MLLIHALKFILQPARHTLNPLNLQLNLHFDKQCNFSCQTYLEPPKYPAEDEFLSKPMPQIESPYPSNTFDIHRENTDILVKLYICPDLHTHCTHSTSTWTSSEFWPNLHFDKQCSYIAPTKYLAECEFLSNPMPPNPIPIHQQYIGNTLIYQ